MRTEVRLFAELMEKELQAHDDRPGWDDEELSWLFKRLGEEVDELFEAIQEDSQVGILLDPVLVGKEAADVANFAMMIADGCDALAEVDDAD